MTFKIIEDFNIILLVDCMWRKGNKARKREHWQIEQKTVITETADKGKVIIINY